MVTVHRDESTDDPLKSPGNHLDSSIELANPIA